MPRRRSLRLLGAAFALLLAACGSGSDEASTAVGITLEAATTSPTGSATTEVPPTSVSVPGGREPALLRAVRAAGQQGFDRVVFEFVDGLPGYRVGYVERPVRQDGSGEEVAVQGGAVLEVRMAPASGAEVSASGVRPTYTGPDRVRPRAGTVVLEVVRVGDFEGQLTWVVGTWRRAPFTVATLDSPARIVVDVRSG